MLRVSIGQFTYGNVPVLSDIHFELKEGHHLAVLGESGGGKSTLLHLIYGLLPLTSGSVLWQGKRVKGPAEQLIPGAGNMKLVAQEPDLMPYTTVSENIGHHLTLHHEQKYKDRVETLLEIVDMTDFGDVQVKTLSGGQKQRIALAKALALEPQLLLLDEPFSSIDTFRKNPLRRRLYGYLKEQGITCITATHDSEEALAFSDEMLILHKGKIAVKESPERIFKQPESKHIAGFFGEVTVLPASLFSEAQSGTRILLPHHLKISENETTLRVSVLKSYYKGKYYLVAARWKDTSVFFEHFEKLNQGMNIYLELI